MLGNDDRELRAIDSGLAHLFADDQGVPRDFTRRVLRRVQEQRLKQDMFLSRVLYAGLCASGTLVIGGVWVALSSVTTLSNDAAMIIAMVGLGLTALSTWPPLRRGGLTLRNQ